MLRHLQDSDSVIYDSKNAVTPTGARSAKRRDLLKQAGLSTLFAKYCVFAVAKYVKYCVL